MVIGIAALVFFLILLGALFFVFWIIMLVDAISRNFKNDSDKVVWILVIVLVGIIGALIYYFVVYYKDRKKSLKWFWIVFFTLLGLLVITAIWELLSAYVRVSG